MVIYTILLVSMKTAIMTMTNNFMVTCSFSLSALSGYALDAMILLLERQS